MFVNNTLRCAVTIILNAALIAAILPWFLLILPVVGAIYTLLYVVFRVGIRRLQRFQLESMAPLLTHVDASVHGLSSVHAYQQVDDFQCRSVMIYITLLLPRALTHWQHSLKIVLKL